MAVKIRIAQQQDAQHVSDILAASYPELMRPAYSMDVLVRALPRMLQPNPALLASGTFYLASCGDSIAAGCGGWSRERPGTVEHEPGLGHIRHFAVRADCTGRGVAKTVFQRCRTTATASGITRFECYSSLNAEPFYAAMGFKTIKSLNVPMGPGVTFPSKVMICDIESD